MVASLRALLAAALVAAVAADLFTVTPTGLPSSYYVSQAGAWRRALDCARG
jgi:hypothetical protein